MSDKNVADWCLWLLDTNKMEVEVPDDMDDEMYAELQRGLEPDAYLSDLDEMLTGDY